MMALWICGRLFCLCCLHVWCVLFNTCVLFFVHVCACFSVSVKICEDLCASLWRPTCRLVCLMGYGAGHYWTIKVRNTWTCVHTSSKTNSSMSTSSKVSSSLVLGHVTAARADVSLLLKVKPLQNAWRYPKNKWYKTLHESLGKHKYCVLSH